MAAPSGLELPEETRLHEGELLWAAIERFFWFRLLQKVLTVLKIVRPKLQSLKLMMMGLGVYMWWELEVLMA
ncbi:hypothetical protein IFM89_019743 [Coptis chinensis]|uniref:Uncharacterized protein n=1 Tax=Coptis chinensis TaxID=261450 RepID=A0A835H5J2_9MAGN|nr:hypothetical protein IFM89_019743 [Coptis chinensis]